AANIIMEEWPEVKIDVLGPADYDIESTLSIIEQQIAKKVTGILVQPWGEDWLPTCDKAVDSGIPVVFLGVDFPKSKRLAYCGTGNTKMGMVAGEWLAEKIGYEGKVAVMRNPGLLSFKDISISLIFNGIEKPASHIHNSSSCPILVTASEISLFNNPISFIFK
ncbi:unnamed protein product, partial [marine sediment metagenome]